MAIELQEKGVPACVLYPGSVATEFIQDAAESREMDLSQSQTPLLVGRAAAELLMLDNMMERTGTIQWVEDILDNLPVGETFNWARSLRGSKKLKLGAILMSPLYSCAIAE